MVLYIVAWGFMFFCGERENVDEESLVCVFLEMMEFDEFCNLYFGMKMENDGEERETRMMLW